MSLLRNIYKDYIQKYSYDLDNQLNNLQEYEVIIVDMDEYQIQNDYNTSLYKIKCKNLPGYVKEKLHKNVHRKIVFKHHNICMVSSI